MDTPDPETSPETPGEPPSEPPSELPSEPRSEAPTKEVRAEPPQVEPAQAEAPQAAPAPRIVREPQPLPYHQDVVRHLQRHAKSVWGHYSGAARHPEAAEAQRLYLLKSTVVLKRESHAALYALAEGVANAIDLGVPLELYQGVDHGELNARLLFLPGVAMMGDLFVGILGLLAVGRRRRD